MPPPTPAPLPKQTAQGLFPKTPHTPSLLSHTCAETMPSDNCQQLGRKTGFFFLIGFSSRIFFVFICVSIIINIIILFLRAPPLPRPCIFKSSFIVQYSCTLERGVSCTKCLHGGVIKWIIKTAFHKAPCEGLSPEVLFTASRH